ncbi:MAG: PQQ-binding-like beta-propeller repeat protein [Acidimicrobiia bacterium]|nr:PQQ-binding-like beta-propeller repeat protein [Acidimicrobiia bacterium]
MARRLAAIVAVDIVGFSRLMASDEDGTWRALNELRTLIDPILETEGGRIFKATGDGVMVEAPSVVGAVRAAIEVQRVVENFNKRRPDQPALMLRIGINLGDVIVAEDGDVYGDGVNVAARLEGLAPPGGICLSDSAYQQVRGRIEADFADRGQQRVKNIPEPVQVWEIPRPTDTPRRGGTIVAGADTEKPPSTFRSRALTAGAAIAVLIVGSVVYSTLGNADGDEPTETSTSTTVTTVAEDEVVTSETDPIVEGAYWTVEFPSNVVDLAGPEPDDCISGAGCPPIAAVLLQEGAIAGVDVRDGSDSWAAFFDLGLTAPVTDVDTFRRATDLEVHAQRVHFVRAGTRLLHSVDLANGRQHWRTLAPFDSAVGGPRLAATADRTYVGFGLGVAALGEGGSVVWSIPSATTLLVGEVSAEGTLVVAVDGRSLYRLDADSGARDWEIGPPVIAPPTWVLAQERDVVSGSGRSFSRRVLLLTERGQLLVIGGNDGTVQWTADISLPPGSAPTDRVIVAGVDGELVSLWMDTGDVDWVNQDVRVDRPPVVANDRVHAVVGNELVTFNVRSGTEVRRLRLPGAPTAGPIVVADVVLFAVGQTLVAVPADG